MPDPKEIAIEAAKAGGKIIADYFNKGSYLTSLKQDLSFLTSADTEAETAVINIIRHAFPHHGVISEERGCIIGEDQEYEWLVDPLDGTDNFVLGIPYFSTSIAMRRNGISELGIVYNPVTQQIYSAERGKGAFLNGIEIHISQNLDLNRSKIFYVPSYKTKKEPKSIHIREALYNQCRRLLDTWSPALDWCLVASGKADAIVVIGDAQIDSNAGTLILQEASGRITDFENAPFVMGNTGCLVASNGNIHVALLDLISKQ